MTVGVAVAEVLQPVAARRAELDALGEQSAKQLEEVRGERDEPAMAMGTCSRWSFVR